MIRHWKPILFSMFLLCVFGAGYFSGASSVRADWDRAKLAQAEADLKTKEEQDKKLAEAEKKATDMRNKFRGLYANLTNNDCPAGDGVRAINEAVRLSR